MEAAKGAWQVTAGVLPGDPLKRYELTLGYTSSDLERDRIVCEKNQRIMETADSEKEIAEGTSDTIFMKNCALVLAHARDVMDPQRVNWVRVDFIWY